MATEVLKATRMEIYWCTLVLRDFDPNSTHDFSLTVVVVATADDLEHQLFGNRNMYLKSYTPNPHPPSLPPGANSLRSSLKL